MRRASCAVRCVSLRSSCTAVVRRVSQTLTSVTASRVSTAGRASRRPASSPADVPMATPAAGVRQVTSQSQIFFIERKTEVGRK